MGLGTEGDWGLGDITDLKVHNDNINNTFPTLWDLKPRKEKN